MINKINIIEKSDIMGTTASALCLVHCLVTPFLFTAHMTHVREHHTAPLWWGVLDLLFIVISLIAVYWSSKHTSKIWVRFAFWISWWGLTFVILNEKFEMLHLVEEVIYIPSIALVVLHLFNRKYCKCSNHCCIDE